MSTCWFLGHRKIEVTENLEQELCSIIELLITEENVNTFLFGSKSEFDSLCHRIVNEFQKDYPDIKRIYFSVYPPTIYDQPRPGIPTSYEETYHPDGVKNAGKATYVKRNYAMIDQSKFCIVYYNKNYEVPTGRNNNIYLPEPNRRSGTKVSVEYVIKNHKRVINVFDHFVSSGNS